MGEEINQSKAYCDASVTNNLIYCSYQEHTALQNKEAFTMKKMIAMMLAALMILTIGACALADVTLDEAKKIALDKAGVAYTPLNANENKELVTEYGVKQAPTLVLLDGDGFQSFRGVSDIKGWLMGKK